MLYFKRKIASHWKLLLLMIGICAVSLYCIIDLVIWSDGYVIENLCYLDIFSFAGFRGFTAVVLPIVGLFLAYRVLHGDFSYGILLRFHNKSTLYARQGLCLLILSFLLSVVCMVIAGLLSFRYAPQRFYNWNALPEDGFAYLTASSCMDIRAEETVQAIKTYFGALSPVRVLCSQFLTLWIACALPMAVELLGKWLGMEILSWILYLGYAGFDAAVMAVNGKPLLYASLFISPADYLLSAVPEFRFLIPICICAVLVLIGYLISEKREFLRKE